MPTKTNPLRLNMLQLKTLTLLQELARQPEAGTTLEDGGFQISRLPRPHGNHFHIGAVAVMATDATGLSNEMVWKALERKMLARSAFPNSITLTQAGLAYDTGLRTKIMHGADH